MGEAKTKAEIEIAERVQHAFASNITKFPSVYIDNFVLLPTVDPGINKLVLAENVVAAGELPANRGSYLVSDAVLTRLAEFILEQNGRRAAIAAAQKGAEKMNGALVEEDNELRRMPA